MCTVIELDISSSQYLNTLVSWRWIWIGTKHLNYFIGTDNYSNREKKQWTMKINDRNEGNSHRNNVSLFSMNEGLLDPFKYSRECLWRKIRPTKRAVDGDKCHVTGYSQCNVAVLFVYWFLLFFLEFK